MNSSLEMAQAADRPVDQGVLDRSREFQKGQVDEVSKRVSSARGAGVELYTLSSNIRATAGEARAAEQLIDDAKKAGVLKPESRVTEANLIVAGVSAREGRGAVEVVRPERLRRPAHGRRQGPRRVRLERRRGVPLLHAEERSALLIGGGDAFDELEHEDGRAAPEDPEHGRELVGPSLHHEPGVLHLGGRADARRRSRRTTSSARLLSSPPSDARAHARIR